MAPLPVSSVSLEDIWAHQSYAGFVALNSGVALGIVLWDYIQLLPEERSLYDNIRGPEWHSPAPWAFVILRYSAIVSAICSVLFSSVRMDNCQVAMSVGQVASIIVVASSGALFCCRLGAMWDYKKTSIAICAIACVLMTGSWIAVATQHKMTNDGPDLPFGTNCQFVHLPSWSPVSYALSAAYSCMIFIMVLERMISIGTMVATNTGWTLINRACLVYTLFAALSSVVILVVYASESPTDLLKRTAAPYLVLVQMAMGARVFLNLRLHNSIITRVEESNQFTAKNWTFVDADKPPQGGGGGSNSNGAPAAAEVRSMETYLTTTTLTVPDTPETQTSFAESALYYDSPRSPRSAAAPTGDAPGERAPRRNNSVRSFTTASTRETMETDTVPEIPHIPRRVRVGSVKSSSSSASYRSPRRKPVPSVRSFETGSTRTASTRITSADAPPRPPRRVQRMDSFKYFATTSNLKADELKSTWHGI